MEGVVTGSLFNRPWRPKGADALPAPEVLVVGRVEDLQGALEQNAAIAEEPGNGRVASEGHVVQ
jgi:hypothetical protein